MKKILIFLMAFAVIGGGIATAQEDSLGITAGLELGFPQLAGDPNPDAEFGLVVKPFVDYAGGSGDMAYEAHLRFPLGILGKAKYGDDMKMDLDLEFDFGYSLGDLSFGLWGDFGFDLNADDDAAKLVLAPWLKYNLAMDGVGNIYAKPKFLLGLVGFGDDVIINMDLIIGWKSEFGLGLELTPHLWFSPDGPDLYQGLNVLVSYDISEEMYFEVNFGIPSDMDFGSYSLGSMMGPGLTISPLFEYRMAPMAFYLGADIKNIASDFDMGVDLKLGFKYSL
ncbi:MAG: hypothetical protein LBH43_05680 [Treponema sp.]|jgi:hypothetical protein|nr:hypothetical protein [Treponema sp.]